MVKKVTAKIVQPEPETKWDARYLSAFVCCPGRLRPVQQVAETLTLQELKAFRKDLLKYSGLERLHPSVTDMLDDMEQKLAVKSSDSSDNEWNQE